MVDDDDDDDDFDDGDVLQLCLVFTQRKRTQAIAEA